MRSIKALAAVVILAAAGVLAAPMTAEALCGEPIVVDLIAGQHFDAGSVAVGNDATNLYVLYSTDRDWVMTETHLAIADSCDDIPQTGNGNFKVGKFPYSTDHDPGVTLVEYVIPLADLGASVGDRICLAAHAVVELIGGGGEVIQEETAWGDEWKGCFCYIIQPCVTPTPTPIPAPPQPTTPDWVKYLVGALLLTIILLLTTMLALVVTRRP